MVVHAPDPLSREGALSQLRRHPAIDLREDGRTGPGSVSVPETVTVPGTVTVLVDETLDEAARTLLREVGREEGGRAVLVVSAIREAELLDVVGYGVGAIVWRHEATGQRLVQAVLAVSRGDGDLPADLLGRLMDQAGALHRTPKSRPAAPASGLTSREVDVLRLVADGFDTGEIAGKLSYSERTVKNVIHGLTTRLRLRNRAHAVAHALRKGYI